MGSRHAEHSLSSSPASVQSSLKGKKDTINKHSGKFSIRLMVFSCEKYWLTTYFNSFAEAMDFRDWCESECVRLIGIKGISLLLYDSPYSVAQ